jgi:cytochrome c
MRKIVLGTAMAAVLAVAPGLAQAACSLSGDAAAGQAVGKACAPACHTFEKGKKSGAMGPNIQDVIGRPVGTKDDFPRYSEAMAAAKGKFSWDEAKVAEYVQDPAAFLEKTNGSKLKHGMNYKVADAAKAKQVAAYLKAVKDNPDCK